MTQLLFKHEAKFLKIIALQTKLTKLEYFGRIIDNVGIEIFKELCYARRLEFCQLDSLIDFCHAYCEENIAKIIHILTEDYCYRSMQLALIIIKKELPLFTDFFKQWLEAYFLDSYLEALNNEIYLKNLLFNIYIEKFFK